MSGGNVFYDIIIGPSLRVGTIPSVNLSPDFNIPSSHAAPAVSLDGGLITNNYFVGTSGNPLTTQMWWIGPDGQNSAPSLPQFSEDGFADRWSGCWFDTIYNVWGALASQNGPQRPAIGFLQNYNGKFTYNKFPMPLLTNALAHLGFYTQNNVNTGPYGGYANNFVYGGIDQLIVAWTSPACISGGSSIVNVPISLSLPYGIEGMDFNGSPFSGGGANCPIIPAGLYFGSYPPIYRLPNKTLIQPFYYAGFTGNPIVLGSTLDNNQNWHSPSTSNIYTIYPKGRIFNGFVVAVYPINNNVQICYTEDMMTFYPLLDITGNLDFTSGSSFGLPYNYFHSGFGYSYLASYYNLGLHKAAYKIYPAFNFSPLIPDKFFVPNVCGCNNSAPILKNGVIQHA